MVEIQTKIKTASDLGDVITAQDIAEYLGISRKTVYILLDLHTDHGGIPNFRVNPLGGRSSRRVKKREFLAWVERRAKGSEVS